MKIYAILLLAIIAFAEGASVPSYFQRCHLNDSKVIKCLTESVNNGWSQLVEEDNTWNELPVDSVEHEVQNILNASITNGKLKGLVNTHFEEINVDTKKRVVSVIFTCPKLSVVGTTNIRGNLVGVKLNEVIPFNYTLYGGVYSFRFRYQLETRDGEQYLKIYKQEMLFNVDKLRFHLSLADQTRAARANKLFDDNWKLVNALTSDHAAEIISDIIATKIQQFLHDIPYNTLFE